MSDLPADLLIRRESEAGALARPASTTDIHRGEGLIETLAVQRRVVGALIMREIYTRFGRDNIGFMWIVIEPAMFCLGVIGMWSVAHHEMDTKTPLVPFLLTGYMPLLAYRHCVGFCMRCMQTNAPLLYHRQVTILSLYTARVLVEMLGTLASFLFCMVLFGIFGLVGVPKNPSLMIGGWALYLWYTAAVAVLIGSLSERSELVEKIWQPLSYVMIPASGTFYMLSWMPTALQNVLLWFPQVNGTEMIRGGYFGPEVQTYYHPGYVVSVCVVLTLLALFSLKDVRKHLELE